METLPPKPQRSNWVGFMVGNVGLGGEQELRWLLGGLTAESGCSPCFELGAGSLASSSVGLDAVAEDLRSSSSSADVMEAVVEILHRAHLWVAGAEGSQQIPDDPAGPTARVGSGGGGVARRAGGGGAAVGAGPIAHVDLPGGDKGLGALRQGAARHLEVIAGVPVVVAT